jgi:molybdenum cofactor synthesis domain-containing protein
MTPKIGTLVVGTEILLGRTRDTNTLFLIDILLKKGLRLSRWTIVPDKKEDISTQLKKMVDENFDLVVVAGGMGPTHDDITVYAVADALELERAYDGKIHDRMMKKWNLKYPEKKLPDSSKRGIMKMSDIPENFSSLQNDMGMAEGLMGTSHGMTIVIVPGVPREYKAVIGGDEFKKSLPVSDPDDQKIREIPFKGKESQVSEILSALQNDFPKLDIGSYPQGPMMVMVRITGRKERVEEAFRSVSGKLKEIEKENP